jgi:hypothetical protein
MREYLIGALVALVVILVVIGLIAWRLVKGWNPLG